jgi:hypothetical protein
MRCTSIRDIDGCKCIVCSKQALVTNGIGNSVDEQTELSKRYLKFNLRGLLHIAVGVCEGARYCPYLPRVIASRDDADIPL